MARPRNRTKSGDAPLPEGKEDATDGWKAAFQHAKAHKNPDKSAIIYADAHENDDEFNAAE